MAFAALVQSISIFGMKFCDRLNFSSVSSVNTRTSFISAGSFSARFTQVSITSGIITEISSTISPSAIRYVRVRQSGLFAFFTNPRLLLSIKAKALFSSADKRTLRTKAMQSAVITGRNTEIAPPSTDMTFSKFVTAAKHTAPKAMKNSIFLVVLGSSSIAIHRTFGTNLFW